MLNAMFDRKPVISALCGLLLTPISAMAGGYDTSQRDWDFLFQQKDFAVEAATLYINPQRRLHDVDGTAYGPTIDVDEAEAFSVQRFGLAIRLGEGLRCLASIQEPWGGHANYGSTWAYAFSAIEQHFTSQDLGLTCAASAKVGRGQLSFIGGVSHQEIEYELIQGRGLAGVATTRVSDSSLGWRTGIAYEIPEFALRASLIHNSQIGYDMTGTMSDPFGPYSGPLYGSISMPQSVEFKFQSGVAPGWLAFGSVKWTDWSVAASMPLCPTAAGCAIAPSGLELQWEDTWTVTVGAAHQFSEQFSLAGNLTWDQGGTRGFTSRTDSWVGGLTAIFSDGDKAELKLTGSAGLMKGGSLSTHLLADGTPNFLGYTATFGDDWVYALGASALFRF